MYPYIYISICIYVYIYIYIWGVYRYAASVPCPIRMSWTRSRPLLSCLPLSLPAFCNTSLSACSPLYLPASHPPSPSLPAFPPLPPSPIPLLSPLPYPPLPSPLLPPLPPPLFPPPSSPPLPSSPLPPPLLPPFPPFRQAATAMRARTALLLAASVGTLVFLGHVRETCGRLSGRVLSAKACGELGNRVYGLDERKRAQPESLLATNSVAHNLRGDVPVGRAGRPRHIWDTPGGRFADLRSDLRSLWKATLMVPPLLPLSLPHPKQGLWAGTSRGL
jgi:hypothetical protein